MNLPTLSAFKLLSIPERFALFVAWCASRPPGETYDYWNHSTCPVATFGKAVCQSEDVCAGGYGFVPVAALPSESRSYSGHIEHVTLFDESSVRSKADLLNECSTYGQLTTRLQSLS